MVITAPLPDAATPEGVLAHGPFKRDCNKLLRLHRE
ncbi:MAG: hypothetical protein ACJA1E_000739, partial [Paracoccaceae bacterium]